MNKLDFNSVQQFSKVLEALLLAAAKPLSLERLTELFDEDERPNNRQLKAGLDYLSESIAARSYQLTEVASGYRLQVRPEYSVWVGRLWEERPQRYSRAMLETLALIAYRQPITRGEIEDVRGVAVNTQIIKTLLEREWIRVVGHKDVPGKPAMLATTKVFLDYFNLRGLDELPNLAELKSLQPADDLQHTTQAQMASTTEVQASIEQDDTHISFSSLLAELDGMEQGLKTEFTDQPLETSQNSLGNSAQGIDKTANPAVKK
ncbi:MAG: SMC-Scp complex subunit ScpB [Pseudomonas sp.]|nr:SMC-Scp complex subunit ScpB [Pseudomonas sp.]